MVGRDISLVKALEQAHDSDGDDLPELGHDGGLGAAPLVHQLHRRVLVREREAAFHLGF